MLITQHETLLVLAKRLDHELDTVALKNVSKKWTMPIFNWNVALNRFEENLPKTPGFALDRHRRPRVQGQHPCPPADAHSGSRGLSITARIY